MKSSVALIVLAVATAMPVKAEPSGVVNKLMDTPATLFSEGLKSLETRVDEMVARGFLNGPKYYSFVKYDWDTNRINIAIQRVPEDNEVVTDGMFEMECKSVIDTVRGNAHVKDGKAVLGVSLYSNLFLPRGYTLKSLPDSEIASLDTNFEIKFQLVGAEPSQTRECVAPLLGAGYSVVRN